MKQSNTRKCKSSARIRQSSTSKTDLRSGFVFEGEIGAGQSRLSADKCLMSPEIFNLRRRRRRRVGHVGVEIENSVCTEPSSEKG